MSNMMLLAQHDGGAFLVGGCLLAWLVLGLAALILWVTIIRCN